MNNSPQTQLSSVAVAIIHQNGKYLMQLRDDVPNIAYPGVWGFFGGHIELEEEPEAALRRELIEEINFKAGELTKFRCDRAERSVQDNTMGKYQYLRHVYSCALTTPVEELELKEGWDLKLLTLAEIKQGFAYSSKAIANKPLGEIHRQIMLDYITSKTQS